MTERVDGTVPTRSQVPQKDTWDLSKLYADEASWLKGVEELERLTSEVGKFAGSLAISAENIKDCLDFLTEVGMLSERIGYYAFLKYSEDAGDSDNQRRYGRVMQVEAAFGAASSYINPELQAIDETLMQEYLSDPILSEYRIMLERILHFKPHVLSAEQERILAMESESAATAQKAFSALTDVDMEFGSVEISGSRVPITQSSYSALMQSPDRAVRKEAYESFYGAFDRHKNSLSALYAGSISHDCFKAKVRGYGSSRAAALYGDNVSEEVYDNLISAVHDSFDTLHEYYALRKELLGLKELRHYDVYVPLVGSVRTRYTYDEASELVLEALRPLGNEYVATLRSGLFGRWVDKYENKGKRSGAFSAGSYVGDPYILLNYKEDVLRDLFTLAHEAGHSMHSYYSVKNNPFAHYNYSIFEAEVASTCNEQLLASHLLSKTEDPALRAYIVGKQLDDVIATIYRQTMFAEFEHLMHRQYEMGNPPTLESFRSTYRSLLESYFGNEMQLEEVSDLEGLRIPHFYRSFYVYKYATGLSAAFVLSDRILNGDKEDVKRYLGFLSSGGSAWPIDSLKAAGVDMSTPAPVNNALGIFKKNLETFRGLVKEL